MVLPPRADFSDFNHIDTNIGNDCLKSITSPAKEDILPGTYLSPLYFVLKDGFVFMDKKLPKPFTFSENSEFGIAYFLSLYKQVSSLKTFNYIGARVKLSHSKFNVDKFRELLPDHFEDLGLLQYLEYGFPLGLVDDYVLQPNCKNHSSSYEFYSYIDKFISNEIKNGGITGPFNSTPFDTYMISPLMTAPKKPDSRRAVFDASFGEFSLNANTPDKSYLFDDYCFSFPKIDDFCKLILSLGSGCFMWKRDLSRFFLQLPLDPIDYNKVCFIWRGQLYFFSSFVWGTRHAGLNGQRVSDAVALIHRSIGLNSSLISSFTERICDDSSPFYILNYSDDFGGCESDRERAFASFEIFGNLLKFLGISESEDKSEKPCQIMTYLGLEFDSLKMELRVNSEKCNELNNELQHWVRRTVASKSELQSLLGKLIWVSKAVQYSRVFVSRIINEIKGLKSQKQKVTLSHEIKKDLLWWKKFMVCFNGIQMMIPNCISFQIAGDACPAGMGCYNPSQNSYFSTKFPFNFLDPAIPIHIKEFLCVIVSVKLWGQYWSGKQIQIFCDNNSVCEVICNLKPKDLKMQSYLREFLYSVCKYNFQPIVSKINTRENDIADFLSRNYNDEDAALFFQRENLCLPEKVEISNFHYDFVADW